MRIGKTTSQNFFIQLHFYYIIRKNKTIEFIPFFGNQRLCIISAIVFYCVLCRFHNLLNLAIFHFLWTLYYHFDIIVLVLNESLRNTLQSFLGYFCILIKLASITYFVCFVLYNHLADKSIEKRKEF